MNRKYHYLINKKEKSMKRMNMTMLAGCVLFVAMIAGCGSAPETVNKEASTSAIRAAEEVGAADISSASLYLQLAREELGKAKMHEANGEKEQSESMLLRAQSDAELAVAISRSYNDSMKASKASERVKKLQQENQISSERK
jgi:hypothetical protein